MPGHKLGKGIPEEFVINAALLDLTEIPGTDNLHFPKGAIKEAQQLAAVAFGSDKTYFLVNGSTCGIHAAIMTLCKPEDKLIVARDCHKSVISGMILAGTTPIYIKPEFEKKFGIFGAVKPNVIEAAINENPDAVGVLITRPNYYGICSDLTEIVKIIHSYGKVLIVDEAHGAHLAFNNKLPPSAMECGADLSIQSAHKTLPAFTQGAYLHLSFRQKHIDIDKLESCLAMLQTSSPSYILMTYLDIAREIMHRKGHVLLDQLLENILWFERSINPQWVSAILTEKEIHLGSMDRTRIVINTNNLGKTGYEVEKILREDFNIQVEMSDFYNIVCIATVADKKEDFERLSFALNKLRNILKDRPPLIDIPVRYLNLPNQVLGFSQIKKCNSKKLEFKKAFGKISMSMVTPYPPGIPVICPGELITHEILDYVNNIVRFGGNVTGLDENGEICVVV